MLWIGTARGSISRGIERTVEDSSRGVEREDEKESERAGVAEKEKPSAESCIRGKIKHEIAKRKTKNTTTTIGKNCRAYFSFWLYIQHKT